MATINISKFKKLKPLGKEFTLLASHITDEMYDTLSEHDKYTLRIAAHFTMCMVRGELERYDIILEDVIESAFKKAIDVARRILNINEVNT